MTTSEAIELIKNSRDHNYTHYGFVDRYGKALDMAIDALEKLSKIQVAFTIWKHDTYGAYMADEETGYFIRDIKRILMEDE